MKKQKENLLFFFIMFPILALTIFTMLQPQIIKQFAAETNVSEVQRPQLMVRGCDMAGNNQCEGAGFCIPYGAGRAGQCSGGAPLPPDPAQARINPIQAQKPSLPQKGTKRIIASGPIVMPTPTPRPVLTRENSPFKNVFKVSCAKDAFLMVGGFCRPPGNPAPPEIHNSSEQPKIVPPNYNQDR